MERAWKAGFKDLLKAGLNPKITRKIIEQKQKIHPRRQFEIIQKHNLKITTLKDKNYPRLLKEIHDPPPVLYYKGRLPRPHETLIAIIGTRKPTTYGKHVTQILTRELASRGISIVSGLALGIDAIAHKTCLNSNQTTYAVLSCGLDRVYPGQNSKLAQRILKTGGLISPYPPGWPPLKYTFYARNRIISGLCPGVLITQAALRSGTSITANHALDQNRDIFAVPGEIYAPQSQGCNKLIKQGAKLITSFQDIFEELKIPNSLKQKDKKSSEQALAMSPAQKIILKLLSLRPIPFDKLVYLTKLEIDVLLSNLTELEIQGLIEKIDEKYFLNKN
ncbi:MAG: DNA-processing protein DprA [Patescibacteria group bacterium]|nr:DNA-processing protein DprA [Patescibacteria group bacterium]